MRFNLPFHRKHRRLELSQLSSPAIITLLLIVVAAVVASTSLAPMAVAQTNISGDIVGSVTDPQGAVIPGATVTVTSHSTGSVKTVTSGGGGDYRVPLLEPGDYDVSVTAAGFESAKTKVTVSAGQTANGSVKLALGQATTTVEVSEATPLLHTEDAQVSTSFTMEQIQSLPNPGNDLTFVAQTSPGVVMNTQMGYGNFSVFGLPGTSNTFTVNGGYENDPFLNLNDSGATNLLLGNNDIGDVTVTSNAYDAAFGGLGGAQVSEISRSGGNSLHGNATYWWNGSSMNANDFFNNATGTPKPFDNVNQWAGAIGGPIKKDKLFWFFDTEGLRVILPTRNIVYAPTSALQTAILGTSGDAAAFPVSLPFGNLAGNGNSAEAPLYTAMFNQYNNAPGAKSATGVTSPGCSPLLSTSKTCVPYESNAYEQFNAVANNFTHEWLLTARIDWNIGANDKAFWHMKHDDGVQATYTSLLDPVFNADSPQPEWNGEFQETHTFSPNVTNQFLLAIEWYSAIFTNTSLEASKAIVPFSFAFADAPVSSNPGGALLGGENFEWPQGRNVTNYQFADDLSWTRGNHTIKVGWSMRRDDVSDYDPSILTTSLNEGLIESFGAGYTNFYQQSFPSRTSQPLTVYNQGAYIQDQWKALPNMTVTYGLRLEHNSNPTCLTNCFAYANGDFYSLPTATTTPLQDLIATGKHRAFSNLAYVGYEPRIGFSWLPMGVGTKTVLRGGFGMFVDTFPATVADNLLNNAPTSIPVLYQDQFFNPSSPIASNSLLIDPSVAGSASQSAAADAAATTAGFYKGASSSSLGFNPSLLTAATKISYPTYEEYSLAVEQQVGRATSISVMYVGNHGYHEPVVSNSANACGFPGLPPCTATGSGGYNPNFSSSTIDVSGASSNYNGMIASVVHRERYVTAQVNYAWSHTLDEVSNGGFLPFGLNSVSPTSPYNFAYNYGNADYDTRNYVSGSYVVTVPYWGGPHVVTDGWEVSGTVFHNTGYPFSITDNITSRSIGGGYGGTLYAQQFGNPPNHCGGAAHNVVWGTPCGFANAGTSSVGLQYYGLASAFGQQLRNQQFGPHFTDTDMDVMKGFRIPGWESAQLKLGAQFFNLFNHANFQLPNSALSNIGAGFGQFSSLQATPTSILGAFLGGDSAPRLIQLKANFVF
jgi:hypothetical protein